MDVAALYVQAVREEAEHYGALIQTSYYNRITGMVFVDGVRIHPYGRS